MDARAWDHAEPGAPPSSGELHVWLGSLKAPADRIAHFATLLDDSERERARRFHFDRHRRRYIARHGTLRTMLGILLGVPPASVAFSYGEHGKPGVAIPTSGSFLRFNLSDSGELVLYAFGRGVEIGVDLERVRPMPDAAAIAERFFAPSEYDVFRSVPPDQQSQAFFNCWTRKEAFVKAIGDGLTCPLHGFEVSLRPGEPALLLRIHGEGGAPPWTIWHLEPLPGYVGALAAPTRNARLVCHRLPW
jgi:4'-phosphopantetheinyl transferase